MTYRQHLRKIMSAVAAWPCQTCGGGGYNNTAKRPCGVCNGSGTVSTPGR